MEHLLLTVLVLAPVTVGAVSALTNRTCIGRFVPWGFAASLAAAAGSALVLLAGHPVTAGPASTPWLNFDGLGATLSLVVGIIGLTVVVYARRNLLGSTEAARFALGAGVVVSGTQLLAVSARLSVLVAAWVLTTAAVLVLLGGEGARRRLSRRRAAAVLLAGDVALVAAAGAVVVSVGDPQLDRLAPTVAALGERSTEILGLVSLGALDLVALCIIAAALARASQLPFSNWLGGTVNAPTSTSALLHAGVVNAGGFVVVRSLDLVGASSVALWVLGACAVATVVLGAASVLGRTDAKGSLAASTSAQMGFMLVACAVAAPAAAMTHLVGHALYKSARFLGVGAVVHAGVTRRRLGIGGHHGSRVPTVSDARLVLRAAVAVAAVGATALVAWPAALTGADATMVGGALAATTAVALWHWVRAPQRPPVVAVAGLAVLSGAVAGYLAAASVVKDAVSGTAAPVTVAGPPAALALAALATVALLGAVAFTHPTYGARVRSAVAGLGHPPLRIARVRPVRSTAPGEFQPAELRSPA
ncbi:MAG: hypothetical protein JJU45_05160 [Acidimicrobiia bacterium]|nr:hypothetical protein [Acidimicrobiia bacterium]